MEFIVREMLPEDVPLVAQMEAENFTRPWSLQDFRSLLSDQNYFSVVCVQKENFTTKTASFDNKSSLPNGRLIEKEDEIKQKGLLLGYAVLLITGEEADITNVCTGKGYRGQGIATALLKKLFETGEAGGVREFFLEVRESNLPARHLYEKLSFKEIGIRKNYYEEPREHAVVMRKITTTHFAPDAL